MMLQRFFTPQPINDVLRRPYPHPSPFVLLNGTQCPPIRNMKVPVSGDKIDPFTKDIVRNFSNFG